MPEIKLQTLTAKELLAGVKVCASKICTHKIDPDDGCAIVGDKTYCSQSCYWQEMEFKFASAIAAIKKMRSELDALLRTLGA